MTVDDLRLIERPIVILILGWMLPAIFLYALPEAPIFEIDLFYWLASFTYIACAFAAVQLTFNSLLLLTPRTSSTNTGEDNLCEANKLISHTRSASLIIMAVSLFSLPVTNAPSDFSAALLFISLRLGLTLLLLGGMILLLTHHKMRYLQTNKR